MEIPALILFIILVAWLLTSRRCREAGYRKLARDGMAVDAEITKRFSGRHPKNRQQRYYLAYRFQPASGRIFVRQVNVTRAEYERVDIGGRVEVLYLPSDPGTSHTMAYLRARGYLA